MERSWEGFEDDKPLWKERRGHLLQFPDHKATEKENLGKNLGKTKVKERAKNQAVTDAHHIRTSFITKANYHVVLKDSQNNISEA